MSAYRRDLSDDLHRPDAVDPARRRGRGEGHTAVSPRTLVAGLGLVLGMIVLGTLLGLIGGCNVAHLAHGAQQGFTASPRGNNYPLTGGLYLAAKGSQQVAPDLSPPTMLGRRIISPAISIDVYQFSLAGLLSALLFSHDRTWPESLESSQPGRTPMTEPLTFDELHEVSPMFRELRKQLDAFEPYELSFDMTALWKAAGRPRGHAPRHYLHHFRDTIEGHVRDQGGGPDGAVLADYETALDYCMIVDRRIMTAVFEEGRRHRRQNPVKALMECPNPLMGLLIETDFLEQGVDIPQAERILIDGVKEAVAGLDEYSAETRVAEVQRVLAYLDPAVEPPPDLDLLS